MVPHHAGMVVPLSSFVLYAEDCLDFLARIADSSVAAVITDPAYESLNRHRKRGTTTRLTNGAGSAAGDAGFFPTIPNALYGKLALEWLRILAPTGSLMLFGDDETTYMANQALLSAGWLASGSGSKTYRRTIVWDKGRIGMGYHVRRRHEQILYWQRPGARSYRALVDYDGAFSSVQCFPRVLAGYPTEKPVPLLEALVKQCTNPGDLVVDCFGGSFSTGEAALKLGRDFAGCDIVPAATQNGLARLRPLGASRLFLRSPVQGSSFAAGRLRDTHGIP